MWVGRGVDTKQFNLLVGSFIFWVRCDFASALISPLLLLLSLLTPVVFWVCRHQRLERGQERLRQQGTRERRSGPAPVLRGAADHRLQHVLKKNKCVCYVLRVPCVVRSQQCNKQVCLYLPCCSLCVWSYAHLLEHVERAAGAIARVAHGRLARDAEVRVLALKHALAIRAGHAAEGAHVRQQAPRVVLLVLLRVVVLV